MWLSLKVTGVSLSASLSDRIALGLWSICPGRAALSLMATPDDGLPVAGLQLQDAGFTLAARRSARGAPG